MRRGARGVVAAFFLSCVAAADANVKNCNGQTEGYDSAGALLFEKLAIGPGDVDALASAAVDKANALIHEAVRNSIPDRVYCADVARYSSHVHVRFWIKDSTQPSFGPVYIRTVVLPPSASEFEFASVKAVWSVDGFTATSTQTSTQTRTPELAPCNGFEIGGLEFALTADDGVSLVSFAADAVSKTRLFFIFASPELTVRVNCTYTSYTATAIVIHLVFDASLPEKELRRAADLLRLKVAFHHPLSFCASREQFRLHRVSVQLQGILCARQKSLQDAAAVLAVILLGCSVAVHSRSFLPV